MLILSNINNNRQYAGKMFITDNGYRQRKNTKFVYIGYSTVTKIKFPSSITIIRNRFEKL